MSIVNPNSLSFTTIRNDLLAYLAAKPNGSIWADFFQDASAGGTIVDLLAGVSEFLTYHVIVARREAYLYSATLRSSVIGIAEALGYSAYRGQRQHYILNVTPNFSGSLSDFQILGTAKGLTVVNLGAVVVSSGVPVNLEVVIGNLKTEDLTVNSGAQFFFRFQSANVSQDFRVTLQHGLNPPVSLPLTTTIINLLNNYYLTFSNPLGAIDAFYLNKGGNIYDTGDILELLFVDYGSDPVVAVPDINFQYGTVNSLTADSAQAAKMPESLQSIQVNAPLNQATQRLVRGRNDYEKLMRSLDSDFTSTSEQDLSNAQVELTYARGDFSFIPMSEKLSIIASLSNNRPNGIAPPVIVDPHIIPLAVEVDAHVLDGPLVPGSFEAKVDAIVATYQGILGVSLDLGAIEGAVDALLNDSNLPFVKYARVATATLRAASTTYPRRSVVQPITANGYYYKSLDNVTDEWAANTVYGVNTYVSPLGAMGGYGSLFRVLSLVGDAASGSSEPDWSTASTPGDQVVDHNVTWVYLGPIIPRWKSSTSYASINSITPNTLQTIAAAVFTGSGLDDLTAGGAYTLPNTASFLVQIDTLGSGGNPDTFRWSKNGGITWQQTAVPIVGAAQDLDSGVTVAFAATTGHTVNDQWVIALRTLFFMVVPNYTTKWQGSTIYVVGDVVIPNPSNGYAFQCTVAGTSGTTPSQPTWPTGIGQTVVDNTVTWQNIGSCVRVWDASAAHSLGDIIESVTPSGHFFKCTTAGTSNSSEPSWDTTVGHTTSDGTAVWTCIADVTSGVSEPTWPVVPGQIVRDNDVVWKVSLIGISGSATPTFPTTVAYSVVDGTVIWVNAGPITDPLTLDWDEFFEITTTLNVFAS